MNANEYLNKMKKIEENLQNLFEERNDKEENLEDFFKLIDNLKIREDSHELRLFLHLLSQVSRNHQRCTNFLSIIEKILLYLQVDIQKYSNEEIFNIFKQNRNILLLLIGLKMFTIDQNVANQMVQNDLYLLFFLPELEKIVPPAFLAQFKQDISEDKLVNHEEKRKIGENDHLICQYIRHDLIDDFTKYIEQSNISLSNPITPSFYDTNDFLSRKTDISLIEYAAFYGSLKIFKHLVYRDVELTPSLWLYAIHSNNPEMIQLLEENHIKPNDETYNECFEEAIKCHHNKIALYFQENYGSVIKSNKVLEYYNFDFISNEMIHDESLFVDFCEFDYYVAADFVIKNKKIDINQRKVEKTSKILNPII